MARKSKPERPVTFRVTLYLYPSRHQAVIAYLRQADGLSLPAKVIVAVTAALTGGGLTAVATETGTGEAAMFAEMAEMLF